MNLVGEIADDTSPSPTTTLRGDLTSSAELSKNGQLLGTSQRTEREGEAGRVPPTPQSTVSPLFGSFILKIVEYVIIEGLELGCARLAV